MHSFYEKTAALAHHQIAEEQKKKRGKDTAPQASILQETESKISEAEEMHICTLDPSTLAKELTATEVKSIGEITPIEIIRFKSDTEETVCPMLIGYIKFTESISYYVSASILEAGEKEDSTYWGGKKRSKAYHGASAKETAQKYWCDVMRHLFELNNRNSTDAVFRGIMKTSPPRIMREEITEMFTRISDRVCAETESVLQRANKVYVRDAKSLEKHLIDASTNKNHKESPLKFKRIIEYLSYIRTHENIQFSPEINHALIHTFRGAKDTRAESTRSSEVFYAGCFLFLDNSPFIL